jgi:hypothetical protein
MGRIAPFWRDIVSWASYQCDVEERVQNARTTQKSRKKCEMALRRGGWGWSEKNPVADCHTKGLSPRR